MTILLHTGLTRNPEVRNTPSEFCPILGDWGELETPSLARMSPMKCCGLHAAKCQCLQLLLFLSYCGKINREEGRLKWFLRFSRLLLKMRFNSSSLFGVITARFGARNECKKHANGTDTLCVLISFR